MGVSIKRVTANQYSVTTCSGKTYSVTKGASTNYWCVTLEHDWVYSNNRLECCIDHIVDSQVYTASPVHHKNRIDPV